MWCACQFSFKETPSKMSMALCPTWGMDIFNVLVTEEICRNRRNKTPDLVRTWQPKNSAPPRYRDPSAAGVRLRPLDCEGSKGQGWTLRVTCDMCDWMKGKKILYASRFVRVILAQGPC